MIFDKTVVPTKSYARQHRAIEAELKAAFEGCLFGDEPILGAALTRFEAALAAYHGVAHAVGVASGSDALTMTLSALGVCAGDEVITGGHTFAGVLSAVLRTGATPVLVDADKVYGQLDAAGVEAAITPRTRAVLAVHMYGHPVAADELAALCARRGLVFIEDGAQAHGARWKGEGVGSFGDATCLSFHPSKNLGALGDGGAVLTGSQALADTLRLQRNLGKADKYTFTEVAPNSKLDTLQAALLEVKLRHLDAWLVRRRQIAGAYLRALSDLPELRLPRVHPEAEHAWHLFVIQHVERDSLRAALAEQGIKTGLHYPIAAADHPAFAGKLAGADTPIARDWAQQCLSLPLSHEHTDEEVARVIAAVRACVAALR